MNSVEGKVAIVTGAREGMGRATSELLASKKAKVVMVSRDFIKLKIEAEKIESKTGVKVFPFAADVSDFQQCKNILDFKVKEVGEPDFIYNFAGFTGGRYGEISPKRPSQIDIIHDYLPARSVDQDGTFFMTILTEPFLRKKNFGFILTISSTPVLDVWENDLIYQIPKAANIQLTKVLARQHEVDGIGGVKIINFAPGNVFNKTTYESMNKEQRQEADKEGWITSEDIAKISYFATIGKLQIKSGDILRIDASTIEKIYNQAKEKYKSFIPPKI